MGLVHTNDTHRYDNVASCDTTGKRREPDGDDFANKIIARRKPWACSARVGIAASSLHIVWPCDASNNGLKESFICAEFTVQFTNLPFKD